MSSQVRPSPTKGSVEAPARLDVRLNQGLTKYFCFLSVPEIGAIPERLDSVCSCGEWRGD